MNLPEHVTAYIHAQPGNTPGEYYFSAWGMDMSSCGYIPLAKVEIPMPAITEEQIATRHLVLLRLKRADVYKEAEAKAAELTEQIGRLEALTYTPQPTHPAQPEEPLA